MKNLKEFVAESMSGEQPAMQSLANFITEAKNTESMFMGKTSKRTEDGFAFEKGEKVFMIKYTTHHYVAQLRGVYDVKKVGKNSVSIESTNEYEAGLKFDKFGIAVVKQKNKYLGKSTDYWVLYNKTLANDKDIEELLEKGTCTWGFSFSDKDEDKKRLQGYVDEINKE